MDLDTRFKYYDENKLYDLILLLVGENTPDLHQEWKSVDLGAIEKNPDYYPRSKGAINIFNKGKIGGILVTGGHWGLVNKKPKLTDAEVSKKYILGHDLPLEKIFLDDRSHETFGSLALPAETPLLGNPNFNDLESILFVTEKGHIRRALDCAAKVFPYEKMDYFATEGPYNPGLVTKVYHASLMQGTRHITEPNPGAVIDFLENEHPFYKYGDEQWFKKPLNNRRIILSLACLNWLVV
jgi:hypothetical protein